MQYCRLQQIKNSNIPWLNINIMGSPVSWHLFWDLNQNLKQHYYYAGKTDGFGSNTGFLISLLLL